MPYTDFILHAGLLFGYLIIFAIVFAESGLLIGFFLPGDSLLFTLGILLSQGHLNLVAVLLISALAAITGDSVGYAMGKKFGPGLFQRPDSWLFKKENLLKAKEFYELHGNKTIVLARFTPIVRTFAPIVAGIGSMSYSNFLFFNIIGGVSWVLAMTLLGYFLGSRIGNIEHYVLPIVVIIIAVSILPGLIHIIRERKKA